MKVQSIFSFCLTIFCAGNLFSQNFIVMEVSGTVSYVERPGAEQCELIPGQTLGLDAVVTLSPRAYARLLFEDHSINLSEAGNYPVKSLAGKKPAGSSSFMKRFFNYVYEGISNTSGQKKIEQYHEIYLTSSSGGVKGFAGGEYGISLKHPVAGNIPAGPVSFEWFSAGDSTLYDFQIIDFQTEGLVFKALLRDTAFQLDLGKLAIEPARKYYWVVQRKRLGEMVLGFTLADDPSSRSAKTEFVVNNQDKKDELVLELENSAEFQQNGPVDRLLMKAQLLEENQYVYEANQALAEALKQNPGSPLVKRVYGAFLVRQGLWHAAQLYLF